MMSSLLKLFSCLPSRTRLLKANVTESEIRPKKKKKRIRKVFGLIHPKKTTKIESLEKVLGPAGFVGSKGKPHS